MSRAWWRDVRLIVGREIDERRRAKSFWITTVILMLAVAAAVIIPAAIGKHRQVEHVGIVGATDPTLAQAAQTAARVTGVGVQVVAVPDLDTARRQLRSGKLAAVVLDGREVLIKQQGASGSGSTTTSAFSSALAQLIGLARRIPPATVGSVLARGIAIPVVGIEAPARNRASRFTGLGVDLLIYIVIFFYGVRITQSVGEEKSSRVVEVLLSTVRATQLLTGKVVGFAALAFAQMLALGVTFAIAALAVGSHAIRGTAGAVVLIGALWLILGYALYCCAFAAAGSLITRQSDAGNASMPLLIPLILVYSLSNGALFNGASPLYHVLAYVPWTAPIAMPTLFAIGDVSAWQMLAAAVLCLLATVATARLAGVIYERAVMRTGARLRVRQVLRADRA